MCLRRALRLALSTAAHVPACARANACPCPSARGAAQNGKRAEWEAIALLPFIDEVRLLEAVRDIDAKDLLTESEKERNIIGRDIYYPPPGSDYRPAVLEE